MLGAYDLNHLSLDDAMITYASSWDRMVYRESAWIDFKLFHKCPQTAVELFNRFWDDIMPNINRFDIVQKSPIIAVELSQIHNPRKYPPPPPETYNFVSEISQFEYEKEQIKHRERKAFQDPKMVALKQHCVDFISNFRKRQTPQPEPNRDSLPGADDSILQQHPRRSSSGTRFAQTGRAGQHSTGAVSFLGINQSVIEHSLRTSRRDSNVEGTSRVSQGSTSRSPIAEMNEAMIEQSVRQSTSDAEIERMGRVSQSLTGRNPIAEMNEAMIEQSVRQSSSDAEIERMGRVSQSLTGRSPIAEMNEAMIEQSVRQSSSDAEVERMGRVSQGSTSRSPIGEMNEAMIEQSVRQSSSDAEIERMGRVSQCSTNGSYISGSIPSSMEPLGGWDSPTVSRDSASQRSVSETSKTDFNIDQGSWCWSTSSSEGETPRKRRRSADNE